MENQKQNEEFKSNGMELLENVIKSNERNTASNEKNMGSNVEVKAGIENLVLAIGQLQLDFEIVKEIPTKIEIVLSQENRGFYEDFYKKMKMKEKFNGSGLGIIILGIFTFVLSITFATNWYKESIKAKSELRQDILKEIENINELIYEVYNFDNFDIQTIKEYTNINKKYTSN